MHRGTGSLTGCIEPSDLYILLINWILSENLCSVIGWDSPHVIVNSWDYRDGLFGAINSGKDLCGLHDSRESLVQFLNGKMAQLELDVVLPRTASPPLQDLKSH